MALIARSAHLPPLGASRLGAALMTAAGFTARLIVLAAVFAIVTAGFAVFSEAP